MKRKKGITGASALAEAIFVAMMVIIFFVYLRLYL